MITDKSYAEVRRRLAAAPDKVFSAFAKAELVTRWLTPSPEIRLTVLEFDFREGGSYRFAYHLPGAANVIVAGSYSVIKPPSEIVFSWVIEPPDEHAGIESEVRVAIKPDGSGSPKRIMVTPLPARTTATNTEARIFFIENPS